MKELKVNLRNQISALRELLFITFFVIIIIAFLIYHDAFSDYVFKNAIIFTSSFLFFIFYVPVIVLHINYLRNGEKYIKINSGNVVFKNISIKESNIESIDIYATNHYFRTLNLLSITYLPYTTNYYYVIIKLKDRRFFFLNSLLGDKMGQKIIENFPNVKINKNIVLYPYI